MCHHLVVSSLETTRLLWYWCLSSSNLTGFHVFGFTVLRLQTTNLCWHKTCLKSNAFKIFARCCTWNFQNHKDSNRFRYKIAFPFGQSWGDLYHMRLYAVVCSCVHAFIDCKPHLQVAFQAWNQSAFAFNCDLLRYKIFKIAHDSHENHETPKCQPCSNPRAHIQGLAPSKNESPVCMSRAIFIHFL